MRQVKLFSALPSSVHLMTKAELRTIAAGIESAREARADVKAVLRALGVSYRGVSFAESLLVRHDLPEVLCAALARVPRRRKGGAQ